MEKIKTKVTLKSAYYYTDYSYKYRGTDKAIYTMADESGKKYVWKTTGLLSFNDECMKKGDTFVITATVKGESEYKGEPQTDLTRVKVLDLVTKALTKTELDEIKRNEQINSLGENDFIWFMPYRQYKSHYSDCETIAGSYNDKGYDVPMIKVIIRDGRLKASGVRGKKFSQYILINELGEHVGYTAVSLTNALKRVNKEYPMNKWEFHKCYGTFEY